jgi:hypothetical protein
MVSHLAYGDIILISLDQSKEDEGTTTTNNNIEKPINKFEEKRIQAKNDIEAMIGETYQVVAGKAKNAPRMECEVVKEHVPPVQYKHRKKEKFGLKDKAFLDHIMDSDNPAGEMFLFLMYGGKGEWCNHWKKMNENIDKSNNKICNSTSTRHKRYIKLFTMKEFLIGNALFIGAADCNEQGSQLWDTSSIHNNDNNNSSWMSMSKSTNFSQWMSSF